MTEQTESQKATFPLPKAPMGKIWSSLHQSAISHPNQWRSGNLPLIWPPSHCSETPKDTITNTATLRGKAAGTGGIQGKTPKIMFPLPARRQSYHNNTLYPNASAKKKNRNLWETLKETALLILLMTHWSNLLFAYSPPVSVKRSLFCDSQRVSNQQFLLYKC